MGSDAASRSRSTKRKTIVDADKGVVLVGDAAIGFPSALGIGTARGFEDATHLVRTLCSALEAAGQGAEGGVTGGKEGKARAIAAALREYEPEVMRERRAMHDVTVLAMQANDTPWLFMPKQVAPASRTKPCALAPNPRPQFYREHSSTITQLMPPPPTHVTQVMAPIIDADTKYSSVKQDWSTRLWIWLARLTYTTRRVASPAAADLRAKYRKE